jgi:hypothetical protein
MFGDTTFVSIESSDIQSWITLKSMARGGLSTKVKIYNFEFLFNLRSIELLS